MSGNVNKGFDVIFCKDKVGANIAFEGEVASGRKSADSAPSTSSCIPVVCIIV